MRDDNWGESETIKIKGLGVLENVFIAPLM